MAKLRHRIGLLVVLAAIAMVSVTLVIFALGGRAARELDGIETQYVPLLEVDRDLHRIATELAKAFEDAAGAAEDAKLVEADQLRTELLARLGDGRAVLAANGADPDELVRTFERYFASARGVSARIIGGAQLDALGAEIETMRRTREDFLAKLEAASTPDRTRLSAAFATARAAQRESLQIDVIVASCVLLLMGLVSFRFIRRTVQSLEAVSDGVKRLARGNFSQPIDVPPGDEIADLAREANRTADRLREYREEADREAQRAQTALVETQRQARAAEAANKELEAFSYSVSHDLRAPLRAIDGFGQALQEDEAARLSPEGLQHLRRVRTAAQRMAELIDDLLRLSRVGRAQLTRDRVDLSALAALVIADLQKTDPDRRVDVVVQPGVTAAADARLARIVLENLLGNAWKFTSRSLAARIELGAREEPEGTVYFVRDNGAGFDMKHAERLFGAFQRLHSDKEFPGTGIGLATVQRIVTRHGGRIWVEAAPGDGATFHFTLSDGAGRPSEGS